MLAISNLHNYQNYAIDFATREKRCALFLDMGLGKTITSLTVINELYLNLAVKNVLIIAPLNVCNTVWKQEIDKWEHLDILTASICTGDKTNRVAKLNEPSLIHIINRENIQWLVENYKAIMGTKKWKWDMII